MDGNQQTKLPQAQSSIFTSQVISYSGGNSQYQNNHDIFHALLVEQTPEGSLRSKFQTDNEFQAQGTKKETKVSTPKWRLGAGAFLNKEIDEGSTEKETTFIPTIIELKSSGPESDSNSDWDSDCDSSSESDNKKKKKTFKLFSLEDVTVTDEEDQKMVIEKSVNSGNFTAINYANISNSDPIDAMLDSKAFILQFSTLAYIISCSIYLFLI